MIDNCKIFKQMYIRRQNLMRLLKILIIIVVYFTFYNDSNSQEISANVVVNKERLSQENMININSLEVDITQYLNNQKFTSTDWDGPPIPVEINIVLSGGTNGNYGAQIFIIAKRYLNGNTNASSVTLKLVDEKWSFNYSQGGFLTFNPLRFDNFVSLLDFYMLTIIGFDMDTYEELAGSNAYDIAKQICNLGAAANVDGYQTFTQPGEFNKFNLIKEFSDLNTEELRKLFFEFYVDGLDQMVINKEQGMNNLKAIIAKMADFKRNKQSGPSVVFQAFFDSKAQEIAEIFKGKNNKDVFDNLMYLDPGSSSIYRDAMK